MFLKSLLLTNGKDVIREIIFKKGLNLVIDETKTSDKRESGNNVGKTTVIRLIDFCLGKDGNNIFKDAEFKNNINSTVRDFLTSIKNNVIVTLILKEKLEKKKSREIVIRKNFLKKSEKIQEINGVKYTDNDFLIQLKKEIFHSNDINPTFRQIISRNIRYEKNKLENTLKVLHSTTKNTEYEILFLFWLGIDTHSIDKKSDLDKDIKIEERIQKRMLEEGHTLSQIDQSLILLNRNIEELENKRKLFEINVNYEKDFYEINKIKNDINKITTNISVLEFRKNLIEESKSELENEKVSIDINQVKLLYGEAKKLIPNLQKTFEETLRFHNAMVAQKLSYITKELPDLEKGIKYKEKILNKLLEKEKVLADKLQKIIVEEKLENILKQINDNYERKGRLEGQKIILEKSNEILIELKQKKKNISEKIAEQDSLIEERITKFNSFFSKLSKELYGEQYILIQEKNNDCYEFNISTVDGNPGTGKKKSEIAIFDLAYIQFADELNINTLHFIVYDQVESIHDNQLSNLFINILSKINCQYIIPILRDKLPRDINVDQFQVLSLSQRDKLFKI